jgi:hypothetical protein
MYCTGCGKKTPRNLSPATGAYRLRAPRDWISGRTTYTFKLIGSYKDLLGLGRRFQNRSLLNFLDAGLRIIALAGARDHSTFRDADF